MLQMYGAMQGAFAAGRAVGEMQEKIVQRFDQDRSGDLSVDEAAGNDRLARKFARIDANEDGALSTQEVGDFLSRRVARDTFGGYGSGFGGGFGEFGMGALNRLSGYAAKMSMEDFLTERAQPNPGAPADAAAVETFDALDGDGDGALSDAEIQAEIARKEAEMAAEAARQAKIDTVNRIDTDGDGVLSLAELQAEMEARQAAKAEAEFDALDSDGDGILSDAEIEAGITSQTAADDTPPAAPGETAPAPVAEADMADGEAAKEAMPENAQANGVEMASEEQAPEPAQAVSPDMAASDESSPKPADAMQTAANASDGAMPAETAGAAQAPGQAPEQVLSMIENVFQTMMDNRGMSGDVGALSQSLYTEAQDLLLDQMQNAADFAANAYGDTDIATDDAVTDERALT